ncbi:hypothetical protein Scep_013388 [Stephania cephalantha]|uniref:Uncharacterized protein n=1 Tax=Stephania cephalantha TaxID=152367 RepID=A0AAP0JJ20_9MAGN
MTHVSRTFISFFILFGSTGNVRREKRRSERTRKRVIGREKREGKRGSSGRRGARRRRAGGVAARRSSAMSSTAPASGASNAARRPAADSAPAGRWHSRSGDSPAQRRDRRRDAAAGQRCSGAAVTRPIGSAN